MIQSIVNLLFGGPKISEEEREEILKYFDDSSAVNGLQTREADRYNSALLIHMNQLDQPESVRILLDASERLFRCAEECVLRQRKLSLPERALVSYSAWSATLDSYLQWARATHDAFVAISEGMTPNAERVLHLFSEQDRHRKLADREDIKLLKPLGLNAIDLRRIVDQASESVETVRWEPE